MTSEIAHQIYRLLVRQESLHCELDHTYTKGKPTTIKMASNGFQEMKTDSYQDGYLLGRVDESHYQKKSKAYRENYTVIISLLGSFFLMCSASMVACTFFPAPSTQPHSNTNTLDITPMLTPVDVMGD